MLVHCLDVLGRTLYLRRLRFFRRSRPKIKREREGTPNEELNRLHIALSKAEKELDVIYKKAVDDIGESEAQIFAIHKMLLEDEELTNSAERNINDGMSAEAAVEATAKKFSLIFEGMDDEYLAMRAIDIRDAADRVIKILADDDGEVTDGTEGNGESYILVADGSMT